VNRSGVLQANFLGGALEIREKLSMEFRSLGKHSNSDLLNHEAGMLFMRPLHYFIMLG
jgi:hypothetical protein